MQDCLRNISLDVRQANRLGQRIGVNGGGLCGGGGGDAWGVTRVMNS